MRSTNSLGGTALSRGCRSARLCWSGIECTWNLGKLAPGSINLRLGAVHRLAYEAADRGLLSADLAAALLPGQDYKK